MATLNRKDVDAVIASGVIDNIDASLEVEVQTDKDEVKILPCRECTRPLVVTRFFAPAKAICRVCKGESPTAGVATVGQPIPGQTDPAKAVDLTKTLVNPTFAISRCPVHPDNEDHVMKLVNVVHSDNYGPGEFVHTAKGLVWKQVAIGETVRHQCQVCLATVDYSTKQQVKFRAVNEPKLAPDLGPPHRNALLEIEGTDPTLLPRADAA